MKLSTLVPIIFLVTSILVSGHIQQPVTVVVEPYIALSSAEAITEPGKTLPAAPSPTSTPIPDMPKFNVKLRDYSRADTCSTRGFIGPCEPRKYIMPENEIVKYAALFLELRDNKLYWTQSNPFNGNGIFYNSYVTDDEQFNYPPNSDYWANPDYYFMNGMHGDCEDTALAVASIFEVKGIQTKVVGGYLTYNGQRIRDWIVEYKINGTYYRYFGGTVGLGFSSRDNFEQYKGVYNIDFEPVIMFDKNTNYMDYSRDWH